MAGTNSNSEAAASFIALMRESNVAPANLDAAKMALVDWTCVCLGARQTPEAAIIARYYETVPQAPGTAPVFLGGTAAAASAALINGTLSHCLDYDDTHIPSVMHGSGPIWAAVLALGAESDASELAMLKAFLCGFEIGASMGANGVGVRLNESGWHSTAVLGRLAAASAAAYLLELDAAETQSALGLAATQAGGLTASFGTMAKPFHAGKAAADGIMAAQLAQAGLQGAANLLDSPKGLFGTIFQDRATVPDPGDLAARNEILLNSLKPYAACQLAHAPIDTAIALLEKAAPTEVERIELTVNPLAIEIAGIENATTPTEGRFSTAYCVALAMHGYPVSPADFVAERLAQPELIELASRVSMAPDANVSRTGARLKATLKDGRIVETSTDHAFGSAGNPMGWPQLEAKFQSLIEPLLGVETSALYAALANFERPGSMREITEILNHISKFKLD